jgi:(2Fe-2S) ferredoxin
MTYYQRHMFFCVNQREQGEACCNNHCAQETRDYAKKRVKALGLHGAGKVRVNNAGCMDRCEQGPVVVIYPDAVWYTYKNKNDVDEIIQEHLIHGRIVERLKI